MVLFTVEIFESDGGPETVSESHIYYGNTGTEAEQRFANACKRDEFLSELVNAADGVVRVDGSEGSRRFRLKATTIEQAAMP